VIVGGVNVRWAPRLRPERLRRLYESYARGIVDEELIDDVACTLYARCESILTVTESIWGKTRCPRCASMITPSDGRLLLCAECNWQASCEDYHKTWQHQHLNGTNAIGIFREFVRQLPLAKAPHQKMLLIDTLIHAAHVDAKRGTQGGPVARNLIEGKTRATREFLDNLAYASSLPLKSEEECVSGDERESA
jgi:hypothetical protein